MNFKKIVFAVSILMSSSAISYADEKVPYPKDYRNWSHVKSMLIEPGHALANPFQGIHHIYANEKAITGLKKGTYSDGAILVFDLLDYKHKDKVITENSRKLVGVMHKDSKKYLKTGGWGFEGFAENSQTSRLTKDGGVSCFGCHAPQKENDYVFSKYRN